jgi:Fe-S-cluster containining protein
VSDRSTWVRTGTCNPRACGAWCCRFLGHDVLTIQNAEGLSDPEFYRLRGAQIVEEAGKPTQALIYMQAFAPCSALDRDTLRCRIYEERPRTCQSFPSDPAQIEGTGCTFTFERVE